MKISKLGTPSKIGIITYKTLSTELKAMEADEFVIVNGNQKQWKIFLIFDRRNLRVTVIKSYKHIKMD